MGARQAPAEEVLPALMMSLPADFTLGWVTVY